MREAITQDARSSETARTTVARASASLSARSSRLSEASAPSATPQRAQRVSRLQTALVVDEASATIPALPVARERLGAGGLGGASVSGGTWSHADARARGATQVEMDPDVWLIALPTAGGAWKALEGAGRAGAIRVSRPYGHLRTIRPIALDSLFAAEGAGEQGKTVTPRARRARRATGTLQAEATGESLGSAMALAEPAATGSGALPAQRALPQIIQAVEVETDAGVFRVERRDTVMTHSDLAWAMAHLESGEPDSVAPLPRRQLALLLTLLPTAEDPDHPELDPQWGWAHRLRGTWERGPLHPRGRLGKLVAFDPDDSGKGTHRACFELLGSEEVVWASGVPCFRTGSVYELTPLGKGINPSRWLTWPLSKGRKRPGAAEAPTWQIARVVYRVGAPRWPLAGVVEPLGPMGVAG